MALLLRLIEPGWVGSFAKLAVLIGYRAITSVPLELPRRRCTTLLSGMVLCQIRFGGRQATPVKTRNQDSVQLSHHLLGALGVRWLVGHRRWFFG